MRIRCLVYELKNLYYIFCYHSIYGILTRKLLSRDSILGPDSQVCSWFICQSLGIKNANGVTFVYLVIYLTLVFSVTITVWHYDISLLILFFHHIL